MPRSITPYSTRTMYGTSRPVSVVVVATSVAGAAGSYGRKPDFAGSLDRYTNRYTIGVLHCASVGGPSGIPDRPWVRHPRLYLGAGEDRAADRVVGDRDLCADRGRSMGQRRSHHVRPDDQPRDHAEQRAVELRGEGGGDIASTHAHPYPARVLARRQRDPYQGVTAGDQVGPVGQHLNAYPGGVGARAGVGDGAGRQPKNQQYDYGGTNQ